MAKRKAQTEMFDPGEKAYGGTLLKKRKGRKHGRPLHTRCTMHMVLRSERAVGNWSFATEVNRKKIDFLLRKFAEKYAVRIHGFANVGNHLHIHLRLTNRHLYRAFIRGLTAAIALAVTGHSRWKNTLGPKKKFWTYRPFTRIVAAGKRAFMQVQDYLRINRMEGLGAGREVARLFTEARRRFCRQAFG